VKMLKLALLLMALATLITAAPASSSSHISSTSDYIQYWLPISPPEELLERIGVGAKAGFNCPLSYLQTCQKDFAAALSTDITIFNDPESFAKLIAGLYKVQIEKSLLNLCAAQGSFRNCLSPAFYDPCTDAFNIFSSQIKNLTKAFQLSGVYDDIEFDCGGGLTQGIVNWKCIVKVNNNANYASTLQPCWDTYKKDIVDNPDQFCDAGEKLSKCLAAAYRSLDTCVTNDVAWWVCERASRRTKLEGFCTPNTCDSVFPPQPTNSPSTSSDSLDFMDFIQSGGLFSEAKYNLFKNARKLALRQEKEQ